MKTKKPGLTKQRLSGEQIVQKKLDEINEFLRKADLSIIFGKSNKANGTL